MPSHPRSRRRSSLDLVAALVLAGCGPLTPSGSPAAPSAAAQATAAPTTAAVPSPSPRSDAEVYAGIRAQVIQIRGLTPTKPVDPVSLDETELRANLTADFDRENTPAELQLGQDELITLGLLPKGSSLRTVMLDFQSGQVAGYYSPEKDQLFVVSRSGGLGPTEMVTYAHEFTHQLQDQRVGLKSLGLDAPDQRDRGIGRLALVEGDATSVQGAWMQGNLTPQQMGELLQASLDPKAVAALQNAPPFVRETSLFPYQNGLSFVSGLIAAGGYAAVDTAFRNPPSSAEQILHPEKYAAHEAPVAVRIPADVATKLGKGWSAAGQDTLGELILGIWLRQGGVAGAVASTAAAGWGGDRLVVLRGRNAQVGVGLITTWDSPADTVEFFTAASTAVAALDPDGNVTTDRQRKVFIAMGDANAGILGAIGGGSSGG
jgi:hypothetical protein